MKKQLFSFAIYILLSFISIAGERFTVGDLTYEILSETNKTVSVARSDWSAQFINIPETISNNGINYNIIQIADSAFWGRISLKAITIPNTIKKIGKSAFLKCNSLAAINIPYLVEYIGDNAFMGCSSLQNINVDDKNKHYKSIDGVLFNYNMTCLIQYPTGKTQNIYSIPNSVINIKNSAFYANTALTTVKNTNSVTTIEDYAFCDCKALTIMDLPTTITKIGNQVFCRCTTLQAINIKNAHYKSIDGVLYNNDSTILIQYPCGKIQNTYSIPSLVTTIGNNAFEHCTNLTSINIPNSVATIESYAFQTCTNLSSVNIPNSTTYIGNDAFAGCTALISINIPNSITNIREYTFYACSALTQITIPNSVTTISDCAFYGCSSMISANIPNTITNIGYGAFYACKKLTSINIPKSVKTIGNSAFQNCSALPSINIPTSIETIEDNTFKNCSALTSVIIPYSVTSIGKRAFENCTSLETITIPNSTTKIGDSAFSSCFNLKEVINLADTPQTIEYVFSNTPISSAQLLVKSSCLTAFNQAPIWNSFGKIDVIQGISVSYHSNNYLNEDICIFYPQGTEIIIPDATILTSYEDFILEGWTSSQDGTGKFFKPEQIVSYEEIRDISTLFAKWTKTSNVNTINTNNVTVYNGVLRNPEANDIRIIDLSGRIVYYGNDTELTLPSGLYILNTKNGNRKVAF